MRMSYSPAAHLFLFLVQWTDCNLAGALGLLRILIYKVYVDGTTTMSTHERKASIREFYAVIYPSLLQLQKGVTDTEDKKQKAVCMERYRRRDDEEHKQSSDVDIERDEECGICMEMNSKIVLPNCNHAMCSKCYREWFVHFIMLRWLCGHTRKDKIRNEHVREKVRVTPIEEKMVENRLRWFGHVQRRPREAPVRRVEHITLSPTKRGRGRPKRTLLIVVERDLLINNIPKSLINDRAQWRLAIHVADPT
ncbi:E3 ubiquitin-protein ligase AIRP2-like isoform X2 [Prosopis cineraria]|nr:E3 ubiquitin-protein ligase AIRP2-like isoform X2 [Prosopis cineraria]